jgi:4'-phosphopantetheinyl transferase
MPSPPLALPLTELHLWLCSMAAVGEDRLGRYPALLDANDRRWVERLTRPAYRREQLVSRALLRTVLARYLEAPPEALRFRRTERGRPELLGESGLRFSLSHTAGLVACAVSAGGDVGVDVERLRPADLSATVGRRYFSAAERERLDALPAELRPGEFISYWVLKEAYTKARGVGLSLGLSSFTVRLGPGEAVLEQVAVGPEVAGGAGRPGTCWLELLEPSAEHRLGIAVLDVAQAPRVVSRWIVPLGPEAPASPRVIARTPPAAARREA